MVRIKMTGPSFGILSTLKYHRCLGTIPWNVTTSIPTYVNWFSMGLLGVARSIRFPEKIDT